jgi:hypothetical protein
MLVCAVLREDRRDVHFGIKVFRYYVERSSGDGEGSVGSPITWSDIGDQSLYEVPVKIFELINKSDGIRQILCQEDITPALCCPERRQICAIPSS